MKDKFFSTEASPFENTVQSFLPPLHATSATISNCTGLLLFFLFLFLSSFLFSSGYSGYRDEGYGAQPSSARASVASADDFGPSSARGRSSQDDGFSGGIFPLVFLPWFVCIVMALH